MTAIMSGVGVVGAGFELVLSLSTTWVIIEAVIKFVSFEIVVGDAFAGSWNASVICFMVL